MIITCVYVHVKSDEIVRLIIATKVIIQNRLNNPVKLADENLAEILYKRL
jgi:hypothetical protein